MQTRASIPLLAAAIAFAQQRPAGYPPEMPGSVTEVYKTASGADLKLYIYNPPGHSAKSRSAAMVFFFFGGWTNGTPKQFENQCKHLASRGMVCMSADYRVASRHKVKAVECVRDAKSAIRYVRRNAARLGIDPKRVAAGGGSAGGHLAAAAGTVAAFDEPGEDSRVSSRPDAMVLFNPALVLAAIPGRETGKSIDLSERAGVDPKEISPYHQASKGAPPAIVFHGQADTTVPYVTAELFAEKMKSLGSRCDLEGYEGKAHGFFNYGRDGNEAYESTVKKMDAFLVSLKFLKSAK